MELDVAGDQGGEFRVKYSRGGEAWEGEEKRLVGGEGFVHKAEVDLEYGNRV